jgi:hypothetical protein
LREHRRSPGSIPSSVLLYRSSCSRLSLEGWAGRSSNARVSMILPSLLVFLSWKGTHVGLSAAVGRGPSEGARSGSTGPTWVSFFSPRHSPNGHLLILLVSLRRSGQVALDCAHRTSTFLSCAFCEQKGHLAAPPFPIAESRRAATFLLGFA